MKTTVHERIQGCFIGGALGDALGYPIEFLSLPQIIKRYGSGGIQTLDLDGICGKALISDDTQMTLFTASGLLHAVHHMKDSGATDWIGHGLFPSYRRWLFVQSGLAVPAELGALPCEENGTLPNILAVRDLYDSREPGRTCFTALRSGKCGSIREPLNNSKGCGGVMRVAPVGLLFYHNPMRAAAIAAEAAAITHGHPSGYIPAALFSSIIARLISGSALLAAIHDGLADIHCLKGFEETEGVANLALEYYDTETPPEVAIKKIGSGWVAEEALAVALYCALKEPDPVAALRLSVNHSGDSDSTGAICGNLLGAMYGISVFPKDWIENLEIVNFITEMADALYQATPEVEGFL